MQGETITLGKNFKVEFIRSTHSIPDSVMLAIKTPVGTILHTGDFKVDYTPIYVLDNGTKAEDRYELIDMKETAKAYAEGNKKIVNKATYNKLVEGLKKLEGIIK